MSGWVVAKSLYPSRTFLFAQVGQPDFRRELGVVIHLCPCVHIHEYLVSEPTTIVFGSQPSALMLVNKLNSSFVIGSVSLLTNEMGAEYLCVKSAIPVISGVDMAEVVATLVAGLIGMVSEIFPVLQRVLDGSLSVTEGVQLLT